MPEASGRTTIDLYSCGLGCGTIRPPPSVSMIDSLLTRICRVVGVCVVDCLAVVNIRVVRSSIQLAIVAPVHLCNVKVEDSKDVDTRGFLQVACIAKVRDDCVIFTLANIPDISRKHTRLHTF
jgi:hypothetical protein